MKHVLDASAVLRYIDKEPGWEEVVRVLKSARAGMTDVYISSVNWGEVLYAILKAHGLATMDAWDAQLQHLPLRIVPAEAIGARRAAEFRAKFKIPYADSYAGSLALELGATLVTADHDFVSARGSLAIQMLPIKKKSATP